MRSEREEILGRIRAKNAVLARALSAATLATLRELDPGKPARAPARKPAPVLVPKKSNEPRRTRAEVPREPTIWRAPTPQPAPGSIDAAVDRILKRGGK
jgi:hypothetical protein